MGKFFVRFAVFAALLAVILAVLFLCRSGTPSHPGFSGLAEHLQATRAASFADFDGRFGVRVQNAAAFEKMKHHILSLYDGVRATNSFEDNPGIYVDCIPFEQQPALRGQKVNLAQILRTAPRPADTPSAAAGPADNLDADLRLRVGDKDSFGHDKFCGSGTIPMRRLTLQTMTRFVSLDAFLAKWPRAAGHGGHDVPDAVRNYHAGGAEEVGNLGASVALSLWNPKLASDDDFSLGQIWVLGDLGANGENPQQTVEAGWQKYPKKYDIPGPALFIFYTTNGYHGQNCYNLECTAFVQVTDRVYLGKGWRKVSKPGGKYVLFRLQWLRSAAGDWWLFYRSGMAWAPVGYYPKALFGTGELNHVSSKIAFGGEVYATTVISGFPDPLGLEMGSGISGHNGWPEAALMSEIYYIMGGKSHWALLDHRDPKPECYDSEIHNFPRDTKDTRLFYGGPSCPKFTIGH